MENLTKEHKWNLNWNKGTGERLLCLKIINVWSELPVKVWEVMTPRAFSGSTWVLLCGNRALIWMSSGEPRGQFSDVCCQQQQLPGPSWAAEWQWNVVSCPRLVARARPCDGENFLGFEFEISAVICVKMLVSLGMDCFPGCKYVSEIFGGQGKKIFNLFLLPQS